MSVSLCSVGPTMATLFINAGYGLWGKNPFNILPILFGVWIYARAHHVKFGRHIYTALFGTSRSPWDCHRETPQRQVPQWKN